MINEIHESWHVPLADFIENGDGEAIFARLDNLLRQDEEDNYPRRENIFAAFEKTPFGKVRVVIIGQDPYPRHPDATGLAFSMPMPPPDTPDNEIIVSSSIEIIYEAIKSDLGEESPRHGNLERWAKQGVLLLNSSLTLHIDNEKKEQARKDWRLFMQAVLQVLTKSKRPIQFMLWGYRAQQLTPTNYPKSLIHSAYHPTPRDGQKARDFINCQHFSKVNDILVAMGEEPINWIRDLTAEEARQ